MESAVRVIYNEEQLGDAVLLLSRVPSSVLPVRIEIKQHKHKRSLAQNALYWMWLSKIRNWLWESGVGYRPDPAVEPLRPYTSDELHDWHRDLFLPRTVVAIGKKVVDSRQSTTGLETHEFTDYLNQIDYHWGQQGLRLPHPDDLYIDAMMERAA